MWGAGMYVLFVQPHKCFLNNYKEAFTGRKPISWVGSLEEEELELPYWVDSLHPKKFTLYLYLLNIHIR